MRYEIAGINDWFLFFANNYSSIGGRTLLLGYLVY